MISQKRLLLIGLFSSILGLLGCSNEIANGQSLPPPPTVAKKTVSFDVQLETFRRLGFTLNPGLDPSIIEGLRIEKAIEERPYAILYLELGRTIQQEPWTPITDRVWDFDVEAIEDHGAYVDIMKNLERISRGELKFTNLKDYVDVEAGKAWVSFTVGGENYKWDLKVDNDWADPGLFTNVVHLTRTMRTRGRYTAFFTGAQNFVLGYETPEARDALVKATGLKIEWLD